MLRTSDGYDLKVGMWIHSTCGVFEVTRVSDDSVWVDEVLWDNPDDCSIDYHLEQNPSMLVKSDMANYSFI